MSSAAPGQPGSPRPAIEADRATELARGFENVRLAIVGDVMLDRYIWGSVDRISPEAPVPVVEVNRESSMLGGAGNVARNVRSLGGGAELVAVTGSDDPADEIALLMAEWKLDRAGLVADASRPTTVKTRVIARGQQVVRFDRESDGPLADDTTRAVVRMLRTVASAVDGVILQDYGKGMLTGDVLDGAQEIFAEMGVPVFVDPKAAHWNRFRGAALVKPNLREAEQLTGIRARGDGDLARIGAEVLERTGAETVAITRSDAGMTLFFSNGTSEHVATVARGVADAAGAGDTAIATLSLARLAGASWSEAAVLSNAAAGLVVTVPGTATLTRDELLGEIRGTQ